MEKFSSSSSMWRVVFGALGVGFAALIVWASMNANFGESFSTIAADPWGIVSLADLYLGFLIFAVFVFLVDGARPASFAWVIALMFLGNVLAVIWLVLRWPVLTERLSGRVA
ncbi:MAG: hypothetical protein ACE360_15055 [Hyphomicrobiales bacterium]